MRVIEADREGTWPRQLKSLLHERLEVLRAYERHEREIMNRRLAGDAMMSIMPPQNPHEAEREDTLVQANALVQDLSVVGYHCTRLHDDEVASLVEAGMRPLSEELIRERISKRLCAGDLSPGAAARLLATAGSLERQGERRTGMTWFVFTKKALRDEGGLWCLLSLWGGEALYVRHMDDPEIGPVLQRLGCASIVQAAVPIASIETYCSVGERIVRSFLHRRGVSTGHEADWEGYIREPVSADRVQRVIMRSDADFARLTACARWTRPVS